MNSEKPLLSQAGMVVDCGSSVQMAELEKIVGVVRLSPPHGPINSISLL